MVLVGIGVIIIGIAFLILSIYLAYTLKNFAGVLNGVDNTVQRLPEQLDDIVKQSSELLGESNKALADTNKKLEQLSPLFYTMGDLGNVTHHFSSSLVEKTEAWQARAANEEDGEKQDKAGSAYGKFALGYYWFKRRQKAKRENAAKEHENSDMNNQSSNQTPGE